MTPFSTLIAAIVPSTEGYKVSLPDDWLQGRTAYGGLSAALCYEAATRAFADLPPLRSAQFCFIGPAGGTVSITPTILRQGRSTVFVSVDLTAETGLAARALLSFGAARESAFDYADLAMPAVAGPEQCESFFGGRQGPSFAKHFDSRLAGGFRPFAEAPKPEMLLWLRHYDEATPHDLTALIALSDAAPPAAMTQFTTPAPISTMTWSIDLLAPAPAEDTGWRLMRTTAESTMGGYSAQAMMIWGPGGEPLMVARQNVAIFA